MSSVARAAGFSTYAVSFELPHAVVKRRAVAKVVVSMSRFRISGLYWGVLRKIYST